MYFHHSLAKNIKSKPFQAVFLLSTQ